MGTHDSSSGRKRKSSLPMCLPSNKQSWRDVSSLGTRQNTTAEKYGKKLDCRNISQAYLKESFVEEDIQTKIFQLPLWHKKFADLLNIVVIVKTNLTTQAVAHVILFSSDLALAYAQLIEHYRLRFQLEFTFRDAKQY